MNAHRRHLTPEQKREAIARYLRERPQASNRKVAKALKVDHETVGAVRKNVFKMAANRQNEHLPIERANSGSADTKCTTAGISRRIGTLRFQRF